MLLYFNSLYIYMCIPKVREPPEPENNSKGSIMTRKQLPNSQARPSIHGDRVIHGQRLHMKDLRDETHQQTLPPKKKKKKRDKITLLQ